MAQAYFSTLAQNSLPSPLFNEELDEQLPQNFPASLGGDGGMEGVAYL